MQKLGKPPPLFEFCWNWHRNAIQELRRSSRKTVSKKKAESLKLPRLLVLMLRLEVQSEGELPKSPLRRSGCR